MNEAYLKVEVLDKDKDGGGNLYQVRVRGVDGALVTWVREMHVATNVSDKESIQNELLDSIRFVASMNIEDRMDAFGVLNPNLSDVICLNDALEIINVVNKFKGYPKSGKIYTKKRDGEDVFCMVLGVKSNWVCYTEKNRKTYVTTVNAFLEDWTYTGECKEKEVDAIYSALE